MAATFASAFVVATFVGQFAQAQTYQVLHTFTGADGANPQADLFQDTNGDLYGTTFYGGTFNSGTVFKLSKAGKETVLYNFCSATNCTDGLHPTAGVIRDTKGNFYGTTFEGGCGQGVVFKLSKTSKETVLHCFAGYPLDGDYPVADLIQDAKGNLFGTTAQGGSSNFGTVFELGKAGETVLYNFTEGKDGGEPLDGVIRDDLGNFYGTTYAGGSNGDGVVFKLSKTGKETVLHSFTSGSDGMYPNAGLVKDWQGNLYGTTLYGGTTGNGTVFKLSKAGKETVLYRFCAQSDCADGANPYSVLIQDASGNLFGTTAHGGGLGCGRFFGCGVVFKLDTAGKETVLYTFTGGADGANPLAGLIQDRTGNLYGTTEFGGNLSCNPPYGCGVVFKLTP